MMCHRQEYCENLDAMLAQHGKVSKYFASLPYYIQEMIHERGNDIHNMDELQRYAENLLAGDK